MRKTVLPILFVVGLTSLGPLGARPAAAAWPSDPLINVPLCTAPGNQLWPAAVSDGAGGAIVAWTDLRAGADYSYSDLYVQRISANGVIQWAINGASVCTAPDDQADPTLGMVSDGVGGAIVVWNDFRSGTNYHIYAQRISAAGTPLWTTDGVPICIAPGTQQSPTIAVDGSGGAVIAWFDTRNGGYDIYAQRISSFGTWVWTTDGVAVCTAAGFQEYPTIVGDGGGGAIVTWFDQRTGGDYTYSDIYAQHITAVGTPVWLPDGVPLCTASGADQNPKLIQDGTGGAIVTWFDYRSGDYDIYAQRVTSAGTPLWTADGIAICIAPGEQASATIVPDGSGGGIVSWRDYRNGFDYDLYAQRISGAGARLWATNGVWLCVAGGDQYDPNLIPDGSGGALATWADYRSGGGNIYAQWLSALGTTQWASDGVAVCTADNDQNVPVMVSDGAGGAIVTWHDSRGGTDYDIYAQRVKSNGGLGGGVVGVPVTSSSIAFALEPVSPNPARGALSVRFSLPDGDDARLELLDITGRRVLSRQVGSLGAGSHALRIGEGRHLHPGIYLVRLQHGSNTRVTRVAMLD